MNNVAMTAVASRPRPAAVAYTAIVLNPEGRGEMRPVDKLD